MSKTAKNEKSPLMESYEGLKKKCPDHILLVRLGDFYECFNDDAKVLAKACNVALTHRRGVPMAGIPVHGRERYMAELARFEFSIAVCEDVSKGGLEEWIPARKENGTIAAWGRAEMGGERQSRKLARLPLPDGPDAWGGQRVRYCNHNAYFIATVIVTPWAVTVIAEAKREGVEFESCCLIRDGMQTAQWHILDMHGGYWGKVRGVFVLPRKSVRRLAE